MEEDHTGKLWEENTAEKLLALNNNKYLGPDKYQHPRVLKDMAMEIVDALTIIFQNTLDRGMACYRLEDC